MDPYDGVSDDASSDSDDGGVELDDGSYDTPNLRSRREAYALSKGSEERISMRVLWYSFSGHLLRGRGGGYIPSAKKGKKAEESCCL